MSNGPITSEPSGEPISSQPLEEGTQPEVQMSGVEVTQSQSVEPDASSSGGSADKKKPKKPSKAKEKSTTPSTNASATARNNNCDEDDNGNSKDWVNISKPASSRIYQQSTSTHKYGSRRMKSYLRGLARVPGGEDINNARGRGRYENPTRRSSNRRPTGANNKYPHFKYYYSRSTEEAASLEGGWKGRMPTNISGPGWYFEDVSKKYGGDTGGHVSHESGIDVDIAYPTKQVLPNGTILRGMGITSRFSSKQKTPDNKSKKIERLNAFTFIEVHPDDIDYESLCRFMAYTVPLASSVNIGYEIRENLIKEIKKNAAAGKLGWSTKSPAYKKLFGPDGKKSGKNFLASNAANQKDSHRHHLHVRLMGIGEVPVTNRTENTLTGDRRREGFYPQRGGLDKFGIRKGAQGPLTAADRAGSGKQGDGRIDPGQPGYSGKERKEI